MDEFSVIDLEQRPDLSEAVNAIPGAVWPEFMLRDQVAEKHWPQYLSRYPRYIFALLTQSGTIAAAANAIPVPWDGKIERLPAGWDESLELGVSAEDISQRDKFSLCALGVTTLPTFQGQGCGKKLLSAMKARAAEDGFRALISPMRPTHKHLHPELSMEAYLDRKDAQGRTEDPWLRTHLSLGAKVLKVCPESMRISGSLAEWQAWTGMKFDSTGEALVPGGLVPVGSI
jgi:GNAT superfamily N-acetyltransferase